MHRILAMYAMTGGNGGVGLDSQVLSSECGRRAPHGDQSGLDEPFDVAPHPPGPFHRWGEGKVNTEFNSLGALGESVSAAPG
jgi:hypothetical protein